MTLISEDCTIKESIKVIYLFVRLNTSKTQTPLVIKGRKIKGDKNSPTVLHCLLLQLNVDPVFVYKGRFAFPWPRALYQHMQMSSTPWLCILHLSQQTGLNSLGQSSDYTGLFMFSTGKALQSTHVVASANNAQ